MSKKPTTPGDGSRRRRRLRSQGTPLPPLRRSPRFRHHQQQKTAAVANLDRQTLSKTEHSEGREKKKKKNVNPEGCSPGSEEVSPACINRRTSTPITPPETRRRSLGLASHYVEQVAKQREEAGFSGSAAALKAEEEYGKKKKMKMTEVTIKKPDSLRRSARLASRYAEQPEKNGEELSYLDLEVIENEDEDHRECTRMTEDDAGEEGNDRQPCFAVLGEYWTKDEEAALRRAYLLAKPSPHFWKKVSKMVPGKSAQECFNRIHADLATPPQPQPRSRAKKANLSPVSSFCFSDDSVDAAKQKVKRARNSRHKSIAAHKTVRKLLRKHQLVDQAHETDLFSVLETSPNSLKLSDTSPSQTPGSMLKSSSFLVKCNEKSSSAHKRLMTSQASDPSPEVLKRIKNVPLHEKYIDHLLSRESRRAGWPRTKSPLAAAGTKTNVPKPEAVKAAKASLISEARETIRQYQDLQANIHEDDNDSDIDAVNDNSDCCDEEDVV